MVAQETAPSAFLSCGFHSWWIPSDVTTLSCGALECSTFGTDGLNYSCMRRVHAPSPLKKVT